MELSYFPIFMGVAGGLALFLFGMEQMTDALKAVAGRGLKQLLSKMTTNRFSGAATGAFVTCVIQSSSVTTVLVVGFISAGLMSLSQSIGIIMGANIGTTITGQILAFKITKYAMLMVAIGFVAWFMSKDHKVKNYGLMILGLGMIFLGMDIMSDATQPLRSYEPFIDLMRRMENPLFGIGVAALVTAVIQSSSATTGIIILLASEGVITLEGGIALAFGANVGTCVTALLAAIGKPREAVQAAVVHVLFNVLGVILWLAFIPYLAEFVRWMSPSTSGLQGMELLAAETPRQIANAHTLFNVANTILFIGFVGPFGRLVEWLVPKRVKTSEERPIIEAKYLNDDMIQAPDLAFMVARMELLRLGRRLLKMMGKALPAVLDGDDESLKSLRAKDDKIDVLHGLILSFLSKLSKEDLNDSHAALLHNYLSLANNLENIGDLIETELVDAGSKRLEHEVIISPETREKLQSVFEKVYWATETVLEGLKLNDVSQANLVMDAKADLTDLIDEAEWHIQSRLAADAPNRINSFRVADDVVEGLKRIYYHSKRMAKALARIEMENSGSSMVSANKPEVILSDEI